MNLIIISKKAKKFTLDEQILHRILYQSSFLTNSGLFTGKIGVALFLMKYSEWVENSLFEDFAGEIIDEIWDEVHKSLPLDFENGLCGIGWGIEYLIQMKLMGGESCEINENISMKIMERDPKRIKDLSREKGLCGILHYILFHLQGCISTKGKITFDQTYMTDLYQALQNIPSCKCTKELSDLTGRYKKFVETGQLPPYTFQLSDFITSVTVSQNNLYLLPIGLNNGLSGFLMHKNKLI